MKTISLKLVAKEPLIITNGSAEGMAHSCLDYIPGSMLLGAFAALWIRLHPGCDPDTSAEFQTLFLDGQVSWGCAYPLCEGSGCVPVPFSYMREKSQAGLPLANAADPGQYAVFNVLPLPRGESLSDWYRDNMPADACSQPPKFKKLQALFMQPDCMREPEIHKVWNTRVALAGQRRALEGQLFGFAAIASGCEFVSEIYCGTDAAYAALARLVEAQTFVRIGHARSAGYGRAEISVLPESREEPGLVDADTLNIYLLSDFLPAPAWENPLDNLAALLEKQLGQKLSRGKMNVAYRRIEGFNGHWRSWRDTRTGLAAGSVIQFSAAAPVKTCRRLRLGADQLEGYGRLLVNPGFLSEIAPRIPETRPRAAQSRAAREPAGPAFAILRERALARLATAQALLWLQDERWRKFIDDAARHDRPTASQRARLMELDLAGFKSLLEKSAGQQWKSPVCRDPFGKGRAYLHEIIRNFLSEEEFLRHFALSESIRAAGLDDNAGLASRAYAVFRRELPRAWGRQTRTRQHSGDKELSC